MRTRMMRTLAALLLAASVFLYITCACGLRLDLGQFVVCTSTLLLALLLLLPLPGPGPGIMERFDSMVAMTGDMIVPQLDRLVVKLSNGASAKPDARTSTIDANWFAASPAPIAEADLVSTKLAYKRIKLMLCMMSEADPDNFKAMMTALGAPPAIIVDAAQQNASDTQEVQTQMRDRARADTEERKQRRFLEAQSNADAKRAAEDRQQVAERQTEASVTK